MQERDARVAAAVEDTAKPVHIIARRDDGIVIEGGKQHVVGAPVVHELLIVPERAIADDQSELAVACAVPVDSPGVRMIANTAAPRIDDDRSYPVSRSHAVVEAIVVFDQVFVPWDRVFLGGEVVPSGKLAGTLSVWERARAVADQADRAELIMGLAQTISDMNGITGVSHVRDKLSSIAVWAKMCRAGWEAALAHASVNGVGWSAPTTLPVCRQGLRRAPLQRDDPPAPRRRRRARHHGAGDRRPRQPRHRRLRPQVHATRWKGSAARTACASSTSSAGIN